METRDIEWAADPKKWKRWPWLPLKRSTINGPEYAVLHADTDPNAKPVLLYGVNLFTIKTYFPTPEMPVAATFKDWRAFAASDWRVD